MQRCTITAKWGLGENFLRKQSLPCNKQSEPNCLRRSPSPYHREFSKTDCINILRGFDLSWNMWMDKPLDCCSKACFEGKCEVPGSANEQQVFSASAL